MLSSHSLNQKVRVPAIPRLIKYPNLLIKFITCQTIMSNYKSSTYTGATCSSAMGVTMVCHRTPIWKRHKQVFDPTTIGEIGCWLRCDMGAM